MTAERISVIRPVLKSGAILPGRDHKIRQNQWQKSFTNAKFTGRDDHDRAKFHKY